MFTFSKETIVRLDNLKSSVQFTLKIGAADGIDRYIATLVDKYQGRRWCSAVAGSKQEALELVLDSADPSLAPRTPAELAIDLQQQQAVNSELVQRLKAAGERLGVNLLEGIRTPAPGSAPGAPPPVPEGPVRKRRQAAPTPPAVTERQPRTTAQMKELAMSGPPDTSAYMDLPGGTLVEMLTERGLGAPDGAPGSDDWKREAAENIINHDRGLG